MSILIKGMEMSKRCIDCPFMVSRDNDDCILQSDEANAKFNSWNDMKASCPLIEIPTPHGRLIDSDATCNDLATVDPRYETMIDWCIRVIEAQPTVIEAEGSEE